jgi:hypothetical protein
MARHELVISALPNRTGLYLCTQEGSSIRPIARFTRGEESAQEFVDWAVRAWRHIHEHDGEGETMGGHDRDGDSVDFNQTVDRSQIEGHEFIEHEDGEIDQDEGY